jgi:hypothetical protein
MFPTVIDLPNLTDLLVVVLTALGLSFVATGSTIGVLIRVPARLTLSRLGVGSLTLANVLTCPYCNAWWGGAITASLLGWSWSKVLCAAFVSCAVAAIVQAQWALGANDGNEA